MAEGIVPDALAELESGEPLRLDLDKLIGSHLCVEANSGAGKSGAIRKVLEITHGRVQHIVIDTEDEFYTLREKFEYLIAGGDNGDCAATVNNAAALAMTILETGFSAIVQINSLPFEQRCVFIREFLEALTGAPKRLWRPALVVLDEAQFYAPQKGYASSLEAIVSFMMLGRKRGFTGVLATPRPADLSKQATSPVNNWMIGRCGQPADRRSAADALGFTANSAEARNLRSLVARQFWVFGPALTNEPTLAKIGRTETTIVKAGQATLPTPPAPAAMREILAGLNAAAAEKKEDAPADEDAAAQVVAQTDPKVIEAADALGFERGRHQGYGEGKAAGLREVAVQLAPIRQWLDEIDRAAAGFVEIPAAAIAPFAGFVTRSELIGEEVAGDLSAARFRSDGGVADPINGDRPPRRYADRFYCEKPSADVPAANAGPITSTMKETLHALAWWASVGHRAPTRKQLGGLLGIIPDGSTMRSRLAALSKAWMIEYPSDGTVALTNAGAIAAPPVHAGKTLVATIRETLTPTQNETFDAIPARPGEAITRERLGEKLGGIEPNGSTMRSRLSELSNRELITYPKPGLVTRQEWVRG